MPTPAAAAGRRRSAFACAFQHPPLLPPPPQAAHTPEPAHEAVQGLSLSPAQADRVKKAAQLLHAELRLPRDALLRWVPALLRAPHFIQHRVRELRALGLTNADVARLLDSAPALLGPPPVVSQVGRSAQRRAGSALPCCAPTAP